MAAEIVIPRLGWSMEEGTFIGWLKQEGDLVQAGEPLFELEGEKSVQEIESVDPGILHIPAHAPIKGTVVAVGAVIGYLLADGETPPAATVPANQARGTAVSASPFEETPEPSQTSKAGKSEADKASVVASPRARRVANELGVDWRNVAGQGTSGRVRERDVRAAAAERTNHQTIPLRQPVPPRRRVIAERLQANRQCTVPVTLTTRAVASALVRLREEFKRLMATGPVPSYQDMILALAAATLRRHPLLTARWERTSAGADEQILAGPEPLALGFAVDTLDGLLVPVMGNVEHLRLSELAGKARALVERAHAGRLTAADSAPAVFTLTNLGAFGIDAFTPVLHDGQAAILGLGAIRKELLIRDDGSFAPDQVLTLSLTFDHRILDGAPAARFLQDLVTSIEIPPAWLSEDRPSGG